MKTITVVSRGNPIEFQSDLTDEEALKVLEGVSGNFAQDLLRESKCKRILTDRQMAWVHKLAVDRRKSRRAKSSPASWHG